MWSTSFSLPLFYLRHPAVLCSFPVSYALTFGICSSVPSNESFLFSIYLLLHFLLCTSGSFVVPILTYKSALMISHTCSARTHNSKFFAGEQIMFTCNYTCGGRYHNARYGAGVVSGSSLLSFDPVRRRLLQHISLEVFFRN